MIPYTKEAYQLLKAIDIANEEDIAYLKKGGERYAMFDIDEIAAIK